MQQQAELIVIGMDPHKRSATIEVMTADETVLGDGRYDTDEAGFAAMSGYVNQIQPDRDRRVWAVEGCNGIGHHIAVRLLAAGEQVVDVPPKLSARTRVFATGQGRKTDATDDPLRRTGRDPDGRTASSRRRRAARGPAGPGRPTQVAG